MGSKLTIPVVSLPKERIVLITGGNAGIGYQTAKAIARMGAKVIIACRSEERAKKAIDKMNEEHAAEKASEGKNADGDTKLSVEFMKLDLGSLKSTVDFIEEFKSSGRHLHCLICNAGIISSDRKHTSDGYEEMFQTNYLGHFLISAHLLPTMKKSGEDCRMVFVSSSAHEYGSFNLETIQSKDEKGYDRMTYYGNSKLFQVMQMYSMARRLEGSNVSVTSLHPGFVNTELMSNFSSSFTGAVVRVINRFNMSRTPLDGAATSITCAVDPKLCGVSGTYFQDTVPKAPSALARNEEHQEALWTYTLKCLETYIPEDVLKGFECSK